MYASLSQPCGPLRNLLRTTCLLAGLLALAVGAGGCERGFPRAGDGPTIDEDRFVAAMGALRVALDVEVEGELDEARREAILREHGVTGQDLLTFAEVHGTDIPYMHQVWIRVDSIVGARAAEADSPPGAPGEGTLDDDEGALDDDALENGAADHGLLLEGDSPA